MGKPWSRLSKESWRYLENNSKKPQANTSKFKINITFGQSTELQEFQSSHETEINQYFLNLAPQPKKTSKLCSLSKVFTDPSSLISRWGILFLTMAYD